MVRFHVLAPIAEQALMVMRAACTREKTVQVGRLAPIPAQAYMAMHAVRTGEKWVRFLRVAPILGS